MESKKLAWGILGPGKIANQFSEGIRKSESSRLVAVGSRSLERAEAFIQAEGGERAYGSYEELLADSGVDAIYVATPHPMHVEWAIKAAEAGKQVLCEKPVGVNLGEADAIFEAGAVHGVFIMEAFMYRCYPQTEFFYQLIREGKIGEPQLVDASFGFRAPYNPESRLFADALAGGGILDVGCYPVSASRLVAGAMSGKPFEDPVEVGGTGWKVETGADAAAVATLRFGNGLLGQCSTGVRMRPHNQIRVTGTEGVVVVEKPWFGNGPIRVYEPDGTLKQTEEIPGAGYHFEIDAFALEVGRRTGRDYGVSREMPTTWMRPEDSLGNMKVLDEWRRAVGVEYSFEKAGASGVPPVSGRTVVPGTGPIESIEVEGFSKPLSKLVLGMDNQPDLPFMRTIVDDFVTKGGNALDTAFIYSAGRQETLLGDYLKSRPDLREEFFIISKGAHLPFCYPDIIEAQLNVSLKRLGVDKVELYLMHRDNTEIPVEAFVDALQAEQERGRIERYGVSNWTLERIQAFNEVARKKGADPIFAVSNNLSLARMVEPIWPDCESAKDPAFAEWLEATQTLLLPWSSQARGFFTDRSGPEKEDDPEMVRCWYSEDNFERKRRAEALAQHLGVLPINVALAWVLARPYPVCPLVGPRRLSELRTSLPGLELELDSEATAWLDLETDERPF